MSGNVGNLLGKPKESKTFAPDARWVLPKSLIGLEFEYEGAGDVGTFYNDPYLPTIWDVHRDDSLKDNGVEFVFKAPMFGQDAYEAIRYLMTKAAAAKFKCSIRAGIHVHLDVRDMETSQLIGLIILYTILEPIIFRWIGDNREHSIFCIPFYKADESLLEACQLVKSVGQDEKHKSKLTYQNAKKFARYAACNLNALYKFGSVEFRHMRTTHDFQRVVDWINIIQSLKAATQKFPTSDGAILRLAKNTATNAFLEYIFGLDLARKIWCIDAPELIRTIGIPTARDLVQYGLTENEWQDLNIPNGKNLGFARYLETDLKRKINKYDPDNNPMPDRGIRAARPTRDALFRRLVEPRIRIEPNMAQEGNDQLEEIMRRQQMAEDEIREWRMPDEIPELRAEPIAPEPAQQQGINVNLNAQGWGVAGARMGINLFEPFNVPPDQEQAALQRGNIRVQVGNEPPQFLPAAPDGHVWRNDGINWRIVPG